MRSAIIFGSALTSSRRNGATIFFRGLCSAFVRAGLQTSFAEESRGVDPDGDSPPEVAVRPYSTGSEVAAILVMAPPPRLVIKFVACGSMDALVEECILSHRQPSDFALFVDGDAPVILDALRRAPEHHLRRTLPGFDGILVLAGGECAAGEYLKLGARRVQWGYCAVDEGFWHAVPPSPELAGDLLFVGNRLPDRDARVEEFFLRPAISCPDRHFMLTGSGWEGLQAPLNVRRLGHLTAEDLRLAYSSAGLVLNVNREPMARYGYSPASRLFEAGACGGCVVSDRWPGIGELFAPGEEILLAEDGSDVVAALRGLDLSTRRWIGRAARRRVERRYGCDAWVRWLFGVLAEWGVPAPDRPQVPEPMAEGVDPWD